MHEQYNPCYYSSAQFTYLYLLVQFCVAPQILYEYRSLHLLFLSVHFFERTRAPKRMGAHDTFPSHVIGPENKQFETSTNFN